VDFVEKLAGALYGQAIGDAMGAPVEGWQPEGIAARFDSVRAFLPPTHRGDPATGKGAGRITDDTLMSEALMRAYNKSHDHLDAYGYARFMIPEIAQTKVWVPEYQQEMPLLNRLWWPEKYPWLRLTVANAEPRSAGIGNCVNCGAAMWMFPVGAANAGDPEGAYQEATALSLAHNESFAVEAAGVMAAACAAAFGAEATLDQVCQAAAQSGRDGTGLAVKAVLAAVDPAASLKEFIARARAAVLPYVAAGEHVADDAQAQARPASNRARPSRTASIEEVPIALGVLRYGAGEFNKTLHAGVFYGRDCDSIAGMAGALFGALYGLRALPEDLRSASDQANRRDWSRIASEFARTVQAILAKDTRRLAHRKAALAARQ
jgi:ADP-ribosylglycohydrolase